MNESATVNTMRGETVEALRELAQAVRDSVVGYCEATDDVESPDLKQLFRQIANDREQIVEELSHYVQLNDADADGVAEDTSFASKLHRAWIDLRAAVTGNDDAQTLTECERGEEHLKNKYEELLPEVAGSPVTDVLNAQYARINGTLKEVRRLKERHAD